MHFTQRKSGFKFIVILWIEYNDWFDFSPVIFALIRDTITDSLDEDEHLDTTIGETPIQESPEKCTCRLVIEKIRETKPEKGSTIESLVSVLQENHTSYDHHKTRNECLALIADIVSKSDTPGNLHLIAFIFLYANAFTIFYPVNIQKYSYMYNIVFALFGTYRNARILSNKINNEHMYFYHTASGTDAHHDIPNDLSQTFRQILCVLLFM